MGTARQSRSQRLNRLNKSDRESSAANAFSLFFRRWCAGDYLTSAPSGYRPETTVCRALAGFASSERSWTTAFLLSLFLGFFGVDCFYLGMPARGMLKAATIGGPGFWYLLDLWLLLLTNVKDGDGRILRRPWQKRE